MTYFIPATTATLVVAVFVVGDLRCRQPVLAHYYCVRSKRHI